MSASIYSKTVSSCAACHVGSTEAEFSLWTLCSSTPALRMLAPRSTEQSISWDSWRLLSGLYDKNLLLVPAKVLSTHLVESVVKGPVEVSEPLQDLGGDLWMGSAFRLSKAARSAAPLWLLQAGKTFGLVEVEVFVWNDPFQTQEVLNTAHLPSRIRHQPLAANKQKMRQGEMLEPVLQMFGIEADAHSAPRRVNQTCWDIFQSQALERWKAWVLGQCLGVVGDSPRHGISHHHNELGLAVHSADAAWSLLCDEVAGCLLHGDLAVQRPRHQVPKWKEDIDL